MCRESQRNRDGQEGKLGRTRGPWVCIMRPSPKRKEMGSGKELQWTGCHRTKGKPRETGMEDRN